MQQYPTLSNSTYIQEINTFNDGTATALINKKRGGLKSKIEGGEDGGDRGVMLKYQIFLYNCSGTCRAVVGKRYFIG